MPAKPPETEPIQILRSENLNGLPWLVHGFSTRAGGVSELYGGNALNLGFTRNDARGAVENNREAFLKQLGARSGRNLWPVVTVRQIHSDIIHCVDEPASEPLSGDGLVTRTPELLIAVQTADCLPVTLVDTKLHAVGVFHAGWRGTFKRIAEKGVGEMRRWFSAEPQNIRAAIGPGIHSCCYEVGPELRDKFTAQFAYGAELFHESGDSDQIRERYPLLFMTARAPGHSELPKRIFLDLVEANRRQLLNVGVPAENITASPLCTSCRVDLLFSYRAEKGTTGRLMGVAGIRA